MPLPDALLLDPVRMDVWVATRAGGLPEKPARNRGIQLGYCENALVEHNVIDLPLANPIQFANCTTVRFFNNRSSAGQLIQGVSGTAKQDELTTLIEDAAILSFL